VCLNNAVEDGLIATNPAVRVDRLPPAHIERDYLRLGEIPRYLDAWSEVYRPLAELLMEAVYGSRRPWGSDWRTWSSTTPAG